MPMRAAQPITYLCNTCLNAFGQPTQRSFNVPVLTYSISFPGGYTQGFGNFEYRIPIVGNIVQVAPFFDGGTNGILRRNALRLDPKGFRSLTDPASGFPDAGVKQQLSIAPGTNFRLRGSAGIEFVVQLPIIQAPFRIYYAYNLHRLRSQIVAPPSFIEPGERSFLKSTFPDIYDTQIQPTLDRLLLTPGRFKYFQPPRPFCVSLSRPSWDGRVIVNFGTRW